VKLGVADLQVKLPNYCAVKIDALKAVPYWGAEN